MKLVLETTGSFQLLGDERGTFVPHNRPTVLPTSHFTQRFIGTGKLHVLAQVNDEATAEEFSKHWEESEGDKDLAVASFAAVFPAEPPAPKPKATKAKE